MTAIWIGNQPSIFGKFFVMFSMMKSAASLNTQFVVDIPILIDER